ncbi:MAG TPA: hypothetical protein DCZ75_16170 [Geobacter sp.]|nr:hypothetical protein [Geobacter sp.]
MFISVIVPTLNRASLLNRTLSSLANQITDDVEFEVIVVDNGSRDNTRETCQRHQAGLTNLTYIYDDRPGLLVGRHVGAQTAQGEILTFIDDDVIIPPYWLQGIRAVFREHREVLLATGNNYPFFEAPPPKWLDQMWCKYGRNGKHLYQLSFLCLGSTCMQIDPGLVWGLNFHIRKTAFYEIGGFNPDILPSRFKYFIGDGELGITRRMRDRNMKAWFDPRLSLYHTATEERLTPEYFLRRSYTEGLMDAYTNIRKALKPGESPLRFLKDERTRKFKSRLKNFSLYLSDRQLFALKNSLVIAFMRGYNEYISHLAEDPLLMEYVAEDDYLDLERINSKYYERAARQGAES